MPQSYVLFDNVCKYYQMGDTRIAASDHVSFEIQKGEFCVILGPSGAGKTTVLNMLGGMDTCDEGTILLDGEKVSGFDKKRLTTYRRYDVGFVFQFYNLVQNLTARENVFLNGAVLGHDRAYMQEHFNSIIDFAELWDFVDVPVKNYSSGMIARLGFSIATEVRADILACDEILSVGDFMFQQKCHDRMEQMLSGGTTLLFVSHDINQVKQLCKRAIWIDRGRIRGDGPAAEVCDAYVEAMQRGE